MQMRSLLGLLLIGGCGDNHSSPTGDARGADAAQLDTPPCATTDGRCIFRRDTFGDEQLWTDILRLQEVVQTLSPTMALAIGLKVDSDAVPASVLASADLTDPATTVLTAGRTCIRSESHRGSVKDSGSVSPDKVKQEFPQLKAVESHAELLREIKNAMGG